MKQTITKYIYKDDCDLEFINTLGWVFLPKGSEMCTVVYLGFSEKEKRQAIKMYEKN